MGLFTPLLAELQFRLPSHWLEWTVVVGGFALAMILAIVIYIYDCKRLHPVWTTWLLILRLGVFAILILVYLQPQDRITSEMFTPSRVIFLVDTSTSMKLPSGAIDAGPAGKRTRFEAIVDLLENTPMIRELKESHEVSFYTFDKDLSKQARARYASVKSAKAVSDDAEKTKKEPPVVWSKVLDPQGRETRLGDTLRELMRAQKGKTLSAVVLISDGQWNSGLQPSIAQQFAKKNDVRLFTVGVGPLAKPLNVRVARISGPKFVNKGDPYDITAYVLGDGTAGREFAIRLEVKPDGMDDSNYAPVEGTGAPDTITLGKDGESKPVVFKLEPKETGKFRYRVTVQPTVAVKEFTKDDNTADTPVTVRERNLGVLIIAGGPSRDYRFARNMLYRHTSIDVDVWLQTVDEKDLKDVSQDADDVLTEFPKSFPKRPLAINENFVDDVDSKKAVEYDVIIAFDPDWASSRFNGVADYEKISKWVSEDSGGMLLVSGDINSPALAAGRNLDEIRRLYPVFLSKLTSIDGDAKADTARPVKPTPEGRDIAFLKLGENEAESESVWEDFEGFFRCYETEGKKAGAIVYMYYNDPDASSKPILLASQYFGVGRTVYLGTSELWRLRSLDESYFDRFWVKAVREVGQGRLSRRSQYGSILLQKDEYFVGESVRVEAKLLDVNNKAVVVPKIAMEVINPRGVPLDPQPHLSPDPARPGFYVGDFSVRIEGEYKLNVLNPAVENQVGNLTNQVAVKFSEKETRDPRQNVNALKALTVGTKGRYYELADFRQVFASVGDAQKRLDKLKDSNGTTLAVSKAKEELDEARGEIAIKFPDRGQPVSVDETPRTLWDIPLWMFILVSLLSIEWLTRKLLKLA